MASFFSIQHDPELPAIEEAIHGGASQSTGGIPPHWHSAWQLVQVVRGDGWVRLRGVQHETPPGTLFLIPPGEVHSNDTYADGCDFRSMLVKEESVQESLSSFRRRVDLINVVRQPVLPPGKIARSYRQFHKLYFAGDNSLQLETMLGELLEVSLGRLLRETAAESPRRISRAVRRARELLWDEAHTSLSLSTLGERCGMSPFELSRQFKAAYGLPPHAWQIQARVERAKTMLRDGHLLTTVAHDLGFSDQPHLTRHFRRITGITPGQYAAAFRKIVQDPLTDHR